MKITTLKILSLFATAALILAGCSSPVSMQSSQGSANAAAKGTLSISIPYIAAWAASSAKSGTAVTKAIIAADSVTFTVKNSSGTAVDTWSQSVSQANPGTSVTLTPPTSHGSYSAGTYTLSVSVFNSSNSSTVPVVIGTSAQFTIVANANTQVGITCLPNPAIVTSLTLGSTLSNQQFGLPWTVGNQTTHGAEAWYSFVPSSAFSSVTMTVPAGSTAVPYFGIVDPSGNVISSSSGTASLYFATTAGSTYYLAAIDAEGGTSIPANQNVNILAAAATPPSVTAPEMITNGNFAYGNYDWYTYYFDNANAQVSYQGNSIIVGSGTRGSNNYDVGIASGSLSLTKYSTYQYSIQASSTNPADVITVNLQENGIDYTGTGNVHQWWSGKSINLGTALTTYTGTLTTQNFDDPNASLNLQLGNTSGTITITSVSLQKTGTYTPTLTLGTQSALLNYSTSPATFAVSTTGMTSNYVTWYTSAAGTTTTAAPVGISWGTSSDTSGNLTSLNMYAGTNAIPGTYYFTLTTNTTTSTVTTLTVNSGPSAVYPLGQNGTITGGTAGSATFYVNTASVATGTVGSVNWYTTSAGTTAASAPTGITVSMSAVENNQAMVTINATSSATTGTYYFKVTEGSTTSGVGTLTVN
jgi:hypothetical protein